VEKIDAIILAGGKGTRLQSVVSDVPKPLAMINGEPFLDILLRRLDGCGIIGRVVLAVGHMAEHVIERYRGCDDFGFDIEFSVERELLGTGGGIKQAMKLTESELVLAMNGDSFVEADIRDLVHVHEVRGAKLSIVLTRADDGARYGNVFTDDEGRIVAFREKDNELCGGLVNAGIYLFGRGLFDGVPEDKKLSVEKELFPAFLGEYSGRVYGYAVRGKFIDIGIPQSYRRAGSYLAGQRSKV
jgi:NDP-sugar pyrophosphorylase family protein